MEIGGMRFPSDTALDNLGTDFQLAHSLYTMQYRNDFNHLPLEDFVYRYYKLKVSYDGADYLFPETVGEVGVDTSMSQIRFRCELAHALSTDKNLKAFIFHVVPTVIQCSTKTIKVLM